LDLTKAPTEPKSRRRLDTEPYTFVDWATQIYSVIVIALILCFHNGTVPGWKWLIGAHALGLLLIHLLIHAHRAKPGNALLHLLRHFYPVILYTAFFRETGSLNRMFFTDYMDPSIILLEEKILGFQPSVLFMEKLPYVWVSEVFYLSYFSYYVMIAGVGLSLLAKDRRQFFHFVSVVSFVFYVCYLVYIVFPVIGPRVFFREVHGYSLPANIQAYSPVDTFPDAVVHGPMFKVMAWIYSVFEAPGAALPSSHVAVALCTLSFSFRYLRKIRFVHLVFVILLCLSTIYCRYHYAIDVVAGILTSAILVPIGNRLYERLSHVGHQAQDYTLQPSVGTAPPTSNA
jgi:membrane-associated phospholipid phosphatase